MLETIVTIALVLLLILLFLGLSVTALLLMLYGPGAATGFAAALSAHRLGVDPLGALAIGLLTFMAVTALTRMMIRAAIRGVRNLLT